MAIDGWYYLHTNGDLIYKRDLGPGSMPKPDSDFVRRIWPIDLSDRAHAWLILIEAKAMGADPVRIKRLAKNWGVNDGDVANFIKHNSLLTISRVDKWQWAATFKEADPSNYVGFGDTALEAFAELVKPGLLEKEKAGTLGKICPLGEIK